MGNGGGKTWRPVGGGGGGDCIISHQGVRTDKLVHFLATYFPRVMIGEHAWQAQSLDVIRYVLLLQHPSDLDEVTSRENAKLSAIKTGSIVPREIRR